MYVPRWLIVSLGLAMLGRVTGLAPVVDALLLPALLVLLVLCGLMGVVLGGLYAWAWYDRAYTALGAGSWRQRTWDILAWVLAGLIVAGVLTMAGHQGSRQGSGVGRSGSAPRPRVLSTASAVGLRPCDVIWLRSHASPPGLARRTLRPFVVAMSSVPQAAPSMAPLSVADDGSLPL